MARDARPDKDQRVVERLRQSEGQFVSGTELARLLGVSRAAVGKRVLALRRRGWSIEAVPNRGYRLVTEADTLAAGALAPLLSTTWLGRLYLPHEELGSTNAEAARQASEGAPHGTVVLADGQSAGRGRLGRTWHSPRGMNLYFSAVLRPDLEPRAAPLLSLAAAVGVAEGVRGFVGRPPEAKWPNDLLYAGRKCAGILLELSVAGARTEHVILGIGVNVNEREFPEELQGSATSLALERGAPVRRVAVLASVLNALEPWVERWAGGGGREVIEAWLALGRCVGQRLRVRSGEELVEGVALGLDEGGALLLRREDGEVRRVVSGVVEGAAS